MEESIRGIGAGVSEPLVAVTLSCCGDHGRGLRPLARDTMQPHGDEKSNPYSVLNELCQSGFLETLLYEDCGSEQNLWKARLLVRGGSLRSHTLVAQASAGSKKDAKKYAAASLLRQYHNFSSLGSPLSQSFSSVTHGLPRNQDGMTAVDQADGAMVASMQASSDVPLGLACGAQQASQAATVRSVQGHPPNVIDDFITRKQRAILHRAHEHLSLLRHMSSGIASPLASKTLLISIDVEWHETGNGEILEAGLSWIPHSQVRRDDLRLTTHHFIVEEFYSIRNGRYVPDNKNSFKFGTSELVAYDQLAERMKEVLAAGCATARRIYLFGHSLHHDIKMLQGIKIPQLSPDVLTGSCDIAMVHQAEHWLIQPTNLSQILLEYDIQHDYLHNAGNDAYYTLRCAMEMMLNDAE